MAKTEQCPNCEQWLQQTAFYKMRVYKAWYTANTWEVVNQPNRKYTELAAGTYKGKAGR